MIWQAVHDYQPPSKDEMQVVLQRQWKKLGVGQDDADFTDARAAEAIIRLTAGPFRLLQRFFVQIERIARINEIAAITEDVVEAAAKALLIGPPHWQRQLTIRKDRHRESSSPPRNSNGFSTTETLRLPDCRRACLYS